MRGWIVKASKCASDHYFFIFFIFFENDMVFIKKVITIFVFNQSIIRWHLFFTLMPA